VVAVAVHDERRQQIPFAVHQAVGGGIERERFAVRDGVLEARAHQRLVRGDVAVRQHADRDLRSIAEERVADRLSPRTDHLHDVAGRRVHVHDIRAIDPRMPAAYTLLAARRNDDARHRS